MSLSKLTSTLLLFFTSLLCFSQDRVGISKNDSIPEKVMARAADKFPFTRLLSVEYTRLTPYKYASTIADKGKDIVELPGENKVKSLYQIKATANVNFITRKNWILGTTLGYKYTAIEASSPFSSTPLKDGVHYHSEALNFTYFSKLFRKPVIYSTSFIFDGTEQSFERIRVMAAATLVLKATPQTKMTLGLAGFIDPSLPVPAFLTFSYEHKFRNDWVVDVILPRGAYIRKQIFDNKGRFSVGGEMDNTAIYLYDFNNTGRTYEFRQLEIGGGVTYEHYFGKCLIATLKTGVRSNAMPRIFDKTDNMDQFIYEAKPDISFYISAGISISPFNKVKR